MPKIAESWNIAWLCVAMHGRAWPCVAVRVRASQHLCALVCLSDNLEIIRLRTTTETITTTFRKLLE